MGRSRRPVERSPSAGFDSSHGLVTTWNAEFGWFTIHSSIWSSIGTSATAPAATPMAAIQSLRSARKGETQI